MSALPTSSPSTSRWLRLWTDSWLILAALHLTWAIWASGGDALPGDLGDSRFNNLVLEHGYQSWVHNAYDWLSPGQFHPVADTLSWSDTHIGTLPIYTSLRVAGLSPERSMQLWFVLVAVLNLWSALRLFQTLRFSPWWSPPLVLAAFASVPWVWMTGTHAQLLPIFPGIWAAIFAWRWAESGRWPWLFSAVAALLTQFAAGPYLAFLVGLILLGVGTLWWVLPGAAPAITTKPKPLAPWSWGLLGVGALLGVMNLWVYLHAVQEGHSRPMHEVADLAPTWASWFSASPAHRWWPTGLPGGSTEHSEHVLFGGFLPWLLALASLMPAWRARRERREARLALVLILTAGLAVLGTVRWTGNASLWVLLCEWIEPLRAFRAIGRIHILVHVLLVLGAGLALLPFVVHASRLRQVLAGGVLTLLLLETWADSQPGYAVAEAHHRRQAVLQVWAEAGDRPVLALAPGYTNQRNAHLQLDAWAAALASQRHTLNGYSGGVSSEHLLFLWHPTVYQATRLADITGVPREDLSIVEQFAPAVAQRIGYEYLSSPELPLLDGFALQPLDWELFSPLETHRFDAGTFYQFTPPARVSFSLPDPARRITAVTGMRPGAWSGDNDSDGYELTLIVHGADGTELARSHLLINPRDVPDDRGFLPIALDLPPASQRRLEFVFGVGPAGHGAWDWPLLGKLQWE